MSRFARRFQRPIIGLALAASAGTAAKSRQPGPPRSAPGPTTQQASTGEPQTSVEDRVGEIWSASERESIIDQAVSRYGISQPLAADIHDAAVGADIDPELGFGLVNTESTFKPGAVSNVGARGLTQVMPRTARWLEPGIRADDLFDREVNLRLGFNYLRNLIDKYEGDVRLALLAYNRGPGTVDRLLAGGTDPDNGYADKVLNG
jgi:soluble lytic murein transglycosylase-like protein